MRCPECGQGALFASYLKIAPRCASCSADLSVADSGDGPAVFVVLVVGAIVTPLLFVLQFAFRLPAWLAVAITIAATIALCLAFLPLFKSMLFAMQWRHKAAQVLNSDVEPDAR